MMTVKKDKTMDEKKKQAIMESESFDDLLNAEYGERGTEARETFEAEADAFCLAECLKERRRLAGLTQEQLAEKIGTKKSYISKIENGHADVQLSTLFRIFSGLGRRISLTVL
jgi:ribosome-binding protein aMBF1 (putative translation factor)